MSVSVEPVEAEYTWVNFPEFKIDCKWIHCSTAMGKFEKGDDHVPVAYCTHVSSTSGTFKIPEQNSGSSGTSELGAHMTIKTSRPSAVTAWQHR